MHQCLEALKVLLNSDIPSAEFDRIVQWNREILNDALNKRNAIEALVAQFMKDKTDVRLYGQILNKLRAEIQESNGKNQYRHAQLLVIRNRMYQHKPLGYVAPGRSDSPWTT